MLSSVLLISYGLYFFLYFTPAGKGTVIGQLRVWPFPLTIIVTFGERNKNPGHRFAGYLLNIIFNLKTICSIL